MLSAAPAPGPTPVPGAGEAFGAGTGAVGRAVASERCSHRVDPPRLRLGGLTAVLGPPGPQVRSPWLRGRGQGSKWDRRPQLTRSGPRALRGPATVARWIRPRPRHQPVQPTTDDRRGRERNAEND